MRINTTQLMRIRINYYYKECMNKFHEYNADWKRLIIKDTQYDYSYSVFTKRQK